MQRTFNQNAALSAKFSPEELNVIIEALNKFSEGYFEQGDGRGRLANYLSNEFLHVSKQPSIHNAMKYDDKELKESVKKFYGLEV